MEWRSRLDRIWTETAAMKLLAEILPEGCVPQILFEDRENYLFAMSCAPDESVVWKSKLMAGETSLAVAQQVGTILGQIHAQTSDLAEPRAGRLTDRSLFDELRIDPYYRTVMRVHEPLSENIRALIASMGANETTLVLGDFSPKNILVHDQGVILVDFETAHVGDPAFDLGFFLSHLVLKAFRRDADRQAYLDLAQTFWDFYQLAHHASVPASTPVTANPQAHAARFQEINIRLAVRSVLGVRHTAACMLARIDGKSPVDYVQELDVDSIRSIAQTRLTRIDSAEEEPCNIPTFLDWLSGCSVYQRNLGGQPAY
jgi:tRNA A-37 threonylcarbamoyl transferase component Bud32